ncbi:hypothetical protein G6L37_05180 [Agrobacterium rubi]|nr:hypothetical protein [Agrobacterium rubi]NTF24749.1 hypothetical protein [Agrobacterium rubi]
MAGVLQEFADAGFLAIPDEHRRGDFAHDLTDKGASLSYGTTARRTSKVKAQKVLDDLLARCVRFNADTRAVEFVERVWVFGSMIDPDKSDVADIDLVIETGRRDDFPKGRKDTDEEMHRRYPEHVHRYWSSYHEEWSVARARNKEIYGNRRHQLLSPNDIYTLMDLHRPCQLVFDDARGGLVDDPVQPHHPMSLGRGENIHPRRVMPSLDLADFSPTDVRWLGTYIPSSGTSELRLLADEKACERAGVAAPTGLDGRNVVAILVTDCSGKKTVVTIDRNHVTAPDGREVVFVSISPQGVLRALDYETQEDVVRQARRCALLDATRLAARREEHNKTHMIHVDLTYEAAPLPKWGVHHTEHKTSTSIPPHMQFSLAVSENGERAISYPDVSRFTVTDWRRFGYAVGISAADYRSRVSGREDDAPESPSSPAM